MIPYKKKPDKTLYIMAVNKWCIIDQQTAWSQYNYRQRGLSLGVIYMLNLLFLIFCLAQLPFQCAEQE